MQEIRYSYNIINDLNAVIERERPDRVVLLTDETTHNLCRPLIADAVEGVTEITIGATDVNKTLDSLQQVWRGLQEAGCTRHSLLVNLGGGMVTDLGGFAAATFKRGIRFVNIPTTLLSMVDAAVGGKTGINFGGLKNEIGAFSDAASVIIYTEFLRTLDAENIRSGYAEMLKHSLLGSSEMWGRHVSFDLAHPDFSLLQQLVRESIELKQRVVTEDPHEHGIRKALNLGHTVGHAFESFLMAHSLAQGPVRTTLAKARTGRADGEAPVLHGYAVAWGLVVELFMSAALLGFPTDNMRQTARFITDYYGRPNVTCDDYETLYAFMQHDKKNVAGTINFTLLSSPGEIRIDQHVERELIFDALDFLREA